MLRISGRPRKTYSSIALLFIVTLWTIAIDRFSSLWIRRLTLVVNRRMLIPTRERLNPPAKVRSVLLRR